LRRYKQSEDGGSTDIPEQTRGYGVVAFPV
jgi:hypothetical protein